MKNDLFLFGLFVLFLYLSVEFFELEFRLTIDDDEFVALFVFCFLFFIFRIDFLIFLNSVFISFFSSSNSDLLNVRFFFRFKLFNFRRLSAL